MRKLVLAALAAAAFCPARAAQPEGANEATVWAGRWTGQVTERVEGRTLNYRMNVDIDLDRDGDPVGRVDYDLGCTGVWVFDGGVHEVWMFDETITDGRDKCAAHVLVELVPQGDTLRVRLVTIESDGDGVAAYYDDAGVVILRRR